MDSMDKVTKPRTQACNRCRLLKARCRPSEQAGTCEKCLKIQKQCVFTEQRPRVVGRRQPRLRTTQLESKLDGLIAMLEQPGEKTKERTPTLDALKNSGPTDMITTCPHTPLKAVGHSTGYALNYLMNDDDNHPDDGGSSCSSIDSDAVDGLIDRGILSMDECELLLNSFREMNSNFPFVMIAPQWTVQSMVQDAPFLLLAVLTTASSANRELQVILDKEFRASLGRKVVLHGEKSIEVLEGLLVYIAWYHFHFVPWRKQQSYQYMQIAIAMTVDLGLNQSPSQAKEQKMGLDTSHHTSDDDDFYSTEARRAYIGCYYLSVLTSYFSFKPNSMHYSDYMSECGNSLQAAPEYPSDTMLSHLVQIIKLDEDINELYRMERSAIRTEAGQLRIQFHVKSFKQQLERWKFSVPSSLQESYLFQAIYDSTNTTIHGMGLLYARSIAQPITLSPPLQIALLTALTSAQSSTERFLHLSTTSYPHLSQPDWGRLIYATFVLYKLCLGPPNLATWDACAARTAVRLDLYLDALCLRLQSLRTRSAGRDLYSVLPAVFASVRDAYAALREECKPHVACAPHANVFWQKQRIMRKKKKAERMMCPALAAWDGRGDVAGTNVGMNVNEADSTATRGEDLGYMVDNEGWLLEGGELLTGMEEFDGTEFWEQVGQDQVLWGADEGV